MALLLGTSCAYLLARPPSFAFPAELAWNAGVLSALFAALIGKTTEVPLVGLLGLWPEVCRKIWQMLISLKEPATLATFFRTMT